MNRDDALTTYLDATSQRINHHGNLLWEEEKHYTWWVYILFGAMLYLLISFQLVDFAQKFWLTFTVSVFGIGVSSIGLRVIRVEGVQLHEALRLQTEILDKMGVDSMIARRELARSSPNMSFGKLVVTFFKTMLRFGGLKSEEKSGIRDCFQMTLLGAIVLFILFDIVSACILLR